LLNGYIVMINIIIRLLTSALVRCFSPDKKYKQLSVRWKHLTGALVGKSLTFYLNTFIINGYIAITNFQ